jgi:hypothetical protein
MNTQPSNALTVIQPQELMRQSTDVAGVCREIVLKTSRKIGDRNFVAVEGWMSIATAHGCIASAKAVERVEGGFRATGEVRRLSDGALVSEGEGFVGEDEPTWFGGETEVWNRQTRQRERKTLPKRHDYAIRAMAQTRAISRACRSAFAHIVVLMDSGLSTTPAEEVPDGGFNDHHEPEQAEQRQEKREQRDQATSGLKGWRDHRVHWGNKKNTRLGDLTPKDVAYYKAKAQEKIDGKSQYPATKDDHAMVAACEMALLELNPAPGTKSAHGPSKPAKSAGKSLEQIRTNLEWLEMTPEDFMKVAALGQWVKEENFADITEDAAADMLSSWETVILPALDKYKEDVK